MIEFKLQQIGFVRSTLVDRQLAPKQGFEGSPVAHVHIYPEFRRALSDVSVGDQLIVLTWLDRADRSVLAVHPRGDPKNPITGVFSTRSPDRPNPIGLHRVRVLSISDGSILEVEDLEALDNTPVLDIKPVLDQVSDA